MRRRQRLIGCLLLVTALFFAACAEDDERLPLATSTAIPRYSALPGTGVTDAMAEEQSEVAPIPDEVDEQDINDDEHANREEGDFLDESIANDDARRSEEDLTAREDVESEDENLDAPSQQNRSEDVLESEAAEQTEIGDAGAANREDGGSQDEPVAEEDARRAEEEDFTARDVEIEETEIEEEPDVDNEGPGADEATAEASGAAGAAEDELDADIAADATLAPETALFGVREAAGVILPASELRGAHIDTRNGEDLGRLDNLIVNLADGQVLFFTVEHGGLLNLGDELLPLPLNLFRWDVENQTLLLDLPKKAFAGIRGFEDNWPQLGRPGWEEDLRSVWQEIDPSLSARSGFDSVSVGSGAVLETTNLTGKTIVNATGQNLAQVAEPLVNLETGKIAHLVLSVGSTFGLGGRQYAVPLDAFELNLSGDDAREAVLVLDVLEGAFQDAPVYDADRIDFTDPEWDAAFREYWQRTMAGG